MDLRKHILILIIACLFVALLAGCSHNVNKEKPKHEGDVMLYIQGVNCGLLSLEEDSWLGDTQIVYYDGTVEYYKEYRFSGKQAYRTWTLSETQLVEAYDFFYQNRNITTGHDVADGVQYHIRLHEPNGKLVSSFDGYIYGLPFENMADHIGPWATE